jgi:hypothetical protein
MNQKEEGYTDVHFKSLCLASMVTERTFATRYIKMCVFPVCSE